MGFQFPTLPEHLSRQAKKDLHRIARENLHKSRYNSRVHDYGDFRIIVGSDYVEIHPGHGVPLMCDKSILQAFIGKWNDPIAMRETVAQLTSFERDGARF